VRPHTLPHSLTHSHSQSPPRLLSTLRCTTLHYPHSLTHSLTHSPPRQKIKRSKDQKIKRSKIELRCAHSLTSIHSISFAHFHSLRSLSFIHSFTHSLPVHLISFCGIPVCRYTASLYTLCDTFPLLIFNRFLVIIFLLRSFFPPLCIHVIPGHRVLLQGMSHCI